MKTTEHIGKVAYMEGNLSDFIGPSADFAAAGLTHVGMIQGITEDTYMSYTFAIIVGECNPDIFTAVMTKAEANEKILSFFKPRYARGCEWLFNHLLEKFIESEPEVLTTIEDDWSEQDILAHLKANGMKLIRQTKYDGPLFEVEG